MEELIKTLPQILRSIGDDPEVAAAAAVTAWKRAAGDALRQHAIPITLKEGSLVVAVADVVWQKQLGAMADQLIYKTNSILGKPFVKRLDLIVDPKMLKARPPSSANDQPLSEVPIELLSAANAITSPQLRQKFVRVAAGVMERRKKEK